MSEKGIRKEDAWNVVVGVLEERELLSAVRDGHVIRQKLEAFFGEDGILKKMRRPECRKVQKIGFEVGFAQPCFSGEEAKDLLKGVSGEVRRRLLPFLYPEKQAVLKEFSQGFEGKIFRPYFLKNFESSNGVSWKAIDVFVSDHYQKDWKLFFQAFLPSDLAEKMIARLKEKRAETSPREDDPGLDFEGNLNALSF